MVMGVAKLHERFNKVPEAVKRAVSAELEKLATELVKSMRAITPVDKGTLRDSIGWTWGDVPAGSLTIGTFRSDEYGKISIRVYAGGNSAGGDAFYARFVEFGTVKMAAQPFFFPTYRANRGRIQTRLRNRVRTAIKGL